MRIDATKLGNLLIDQLKANGIAVETEPQAAAKAEQQYFAPKAAPAPVAPDTKRLEELAIGLEAELTRILPSLIAQAGGAQGQRAVAIIVG